ncbi:MAG: YibE/F family protein [Anaerolineales bacterium]|nr:YibE/F family protein [Anaerolineales bacterium]
MKNNSSTLGYLFITITITLGIIWLILSRPTLEQNGQYTIGTAEGTVRAEVTEILEEGDITLGETTQTYRILRVKVLEGQWEGLEFDIDYGQRQVRPPGILPEIGDEVLITLGQDQNNVLTAYFTDFVRTRPVLILLATFAVFSVVISGWKGIRGLIGMAISLAVIIYYILPNILAGRDPVLISITGAFVLLASTLYLVYGWTLKTHAAVLGTLIALILTGLMADFFVNLTRLTGFGSEDALFLLQAQNIQINLRGLVLGGMLIGALGVLDDLVITQASVVFEIHHTDPGLKFRWLFKRAMVVGQDHVAATVNTLVLAYAGAALPTLLLFSISGTAFSQLLNLEFVTEEVVRTLVGSLGLFASVPITTALACWVVLKHHEWGAWVKWLGPEGGGHSH